VEVIDLVNDGSGLGFGIIGGRSTGVVVKTILPGGVADRVSIQIMLLFETSLLVHASRTWSGLFFYFFFF
jgi:hypothetical protein